MINRSKLSIFLASTVLASLAAFENEGGGWKKDADGKLAVDANGNPVWTNTAGQDMSVQGDTISRLNGEAKTHREAKEGLETKLKAYEGIDPEKARKAIEIAAKVDQKQLIDAGEVDRVRDQIKAEFTAQLTEKDKALGEATGRYDNLLIGNVFKTDWVRDNVAVPADMFEAAFRGNFKVEDGKPVAYDRAGNRLMSSKNVGEYATPDEAIELLVGTHPHKDNILRSSAGTGSGNPGNGGQRPGGRIMKRSEFETKTPVEQSAIMVKARAGEMQVVD